MEILDRERPKERTEGEKAMGERGVKLLLDDDERMLRRSLIEGNLTRWQLKDDAERTSGQLRPGCSERTTAREGCIFDEIASTRRRLWEDGSEVPVLTTTFDGERMAKRGR